jgi:heterodisulfide reductase subunit A-like polyferredoxin
MAKVEYDLLVIGAGAAGSSAVSTIAKLGKRVALVGVTATYIESPMKRILNFIRVLCICKKAAVLNGRRRTLSTLNVKE